MPKSEAHIPQPNEKALDGVSQMPGRAIVPHQYQWKKLQREFCMQEEYKSVTTWLREKKGWSEAQIKMGYTTENTVGWGKKRAEIQQKIFDAAVERAKQEQTKMVPTLYEAKKLMLIKVIGDLERWWKIKASEKKLIYQIIKTELGEPMSVQVNANINAGVDPVEALLREYGLVKDGRVIDVGEGEDEPENPSGN